MTQRIWNICLAGGPGGGKSSSQAYFRQRLSDMGFHVLLLPEIATLVINAGLSPGNVPRNVFQSLILDQTLHLRESFNRIAKHLPSEKIVAFSDRGSADIMAYCSPHEYELIMREQNHTIVSLRDELYDGVLFFRSPAVDAPTYYTTANNPARKETIDEARALDERTLAVWTGHPHLRVIDNSTDFEGKLRRAFQALCRILEIPVPLEIERKYLIKHCNLSELPRPLAQLHITQYYLRDVGTGGVERIRARGQGGGYTFYHTIKRATGTAGKRIEIERQITASEYLELLRRADPHLAPIDKLRHCFVYNSQYFELDVFAEPHGLILLERELTEENEQIDLPPFLKPYAIDVTEDNSYSNYEIARQLAKAA